MICSLALAAVMAGAALPAAAATAEHQQTPAGVQATEDHWSEAFVSGDEAYLSTLLDPAYVSVNRSGKARPKADIIALSRKVAAMPGCMPRRTNGALNVALAAAYRRSQARARHRPAPTAGPLTAAKSAWLAADRDAGTATAPSDGSVAAAIDRRSGCGMRAAHEQVRQAEALTAMPRVAVAVDAGTLPVAHLDVVARVLDGSSDAVESALRSTEGQATVVRLAESTDVRRFSRDLSAWVAALDPAQLERDHQGQRAARFLHVSDAPDGTYLKGRLDRVSGEIVRRARFVFGGPT